jgi:multidrug resistance efflux pump
MSTLTRDDLTSRLLELPRLLNEAEREALRLQSRVTAAKENLADRESVCILAGVPGANEAARQAYLRHETTTWRHALQAAQEEAQAAGVRLRALQEEGKALRAVARLVGGVDEE